MTVTHVAVKKKRVNICRPFSLNLRAINTHHPHQKSQVFQPLY